MGDTYSHGHHASVLRSHLWRTAENSAGHLLPHLRPGVDVRASSSTWTFADAEARSWWGDLWAERVEVSAFAEQTVAYGLVEPDELADMAAAWRRWAEQPDGFFAVLHGEVLATR